MPDTACSNPACSVASATKQCSACHRTRYCSVACSRADWQSHKSKCMSEKKINAMLDKINAELDAKPAKRPSRKKCTGCGVRFSDEGDEDGEYFVDDECPDCGYMACESCVCDSSNGSCYCQNSNFGRPYCTMAYRWYHEGRGKSYRGDRHPENSLDEYPEAFETTPRKCGNCNEMKLCLKKEWLQTEM